MQIESVTLKNFRCYGPEPTTIHFNELTALIGANACGKTTVLQALTRLFGVNSSERRIQKDDFHVPFNANIDDINETSLFIEVSLGFPELLEDGGSKSIAIPDCFHHMVLEDEGGSPKCRIRLEATWAKGNLPEGDIEERVYWLKSSNDEDKQDMKAHERSRIHVLYVPANRDPSKQLKNVSGTLLARVFSAVKWSDAPKEALKEASEKVNTLFQKEEGMQLVHDEIEKNWVELHDRPTYSNLSIQFVSNNIEDVLKHVELMFSPAEDGTKRGIQLLSDGLRSLFYFALVGGIFDIEQKVIRETLAGTSNGDGVTGLEENRLSPPILTIFAVEEPENHLAPHYLGRITDLFQRIATSPSAQVLITSHSTSIIKRIDPNDIRHFRLNPISKTSIVRSIILPKDDAEAHKYIREAVHAYPELYFARLVILGEGDSEEVVLPRLAEAHGLAIDKSFISIVPLGGRHVNHFWKLLHELSIPYITLLDLDRERHGGGWGRIKYAYDQLMKIGIKREKLLALNDVDVLSEVEFNKLHEKDVSDTDEMEAWINDLEEYDVFFSAPLDFDFLMLESFTDAYRNAYRGGPRDRKSVV